MKQYWESLQVREQRTLLIGAVVLGLIGIYSLIVEPLFTGMERLQTSVEQQEEDLLWMKQAAAKVASLKQHSGNTAAVTGKTALMSLIDQTARKYELRNTLQRINPVGENVRVQFESASFDQLLRWIEELSIRHHVSVDTLTIARQQSAGRVDATIVLEAVK